MTQSQPAAAVLKKRFCDTFSCSHQQIWNAEEEEFAWNHKRLKSVSLSGSQSLPAVTLQREPLRYQNGRRRGEGPWTC